MGEVYRARDTRLDRAVAIKVLATAAADDAQGRERFEREARAISSLNHPHICVLYDVGRERPAGAGAVDAAPVDFLVMEYLEGETLAARLTRGAGSAGTEGVPPMAVNEVVAIAVQIVSALDRAHRQGIVHRDLKPGNVMLTKATGPAASRLGSAALHVKLLDFGLARLTRSGAAHADGLGQGLVSLAQMSTPTMDLPLTMKGTILGTLQYMSPEQLEGREVDARADIFACGAVLYEMITGRRPFEGRSQASLIGAILDRDPPLVTSLQPTTPPLLAELVARCLAKDPDDRWQSARDLQRQLEWIATHAAAPTTADVVASDSHSRSRGRLLRVGAALLGTAVLSGGLVAWRLRPMTPLSPPLVSRFSIELPEGQGFSRSGRHVLALSPDGTRLAFVSNRSIYVRHLNELTATPLAGTVGTDPSEPMFSPDGQWLAFWAAGALKKVAIGGGAPIAIAAADNPYGGSWQGDRILIGQTAPRGIVEVPAAGGAAKLLVSVDEAKEEFAQSPQLLSDGRAVLFTLRSGNQSWEDASIVVQDLASGRRTVLVSNGTDGHVLPTGHLLYARESLLFAAPFDQSRLSAGATPVPLQHDIQLASGGFSGAAQIAWSANGSFAFAPTDAPDKALILVDRQGRSEKVALPSRRYQAASNQMRVSPDGRAVAMTVLSDGDRAVGRGQDIWVWQIARGTLSQLSTTKAGSNPVWTPDSRRVCYASQGDLLCQTADGRGSPERMFAKGWLIPERTLASVAPDGAMLVVEKHSRTGMDIATASLDSGAQTRPLVQGPGDDVDPTVSPDGRWLAYSAASGQRQLFVQPYPHVEQGRWPVSIESGDYPLWSASGRELYFLSIAGSAGVSNPTAIMSVSVPPGPTFNPSKPVELFKYPAGALRGFAAMADGRFLFVVPATPEGATTRAEIVVVQNWFTELQQRVPTR
jgi:serine/threonine-protein kinase